VLEAAYVAALEAEYVAVLEAAYVAVLEAVYVAVLEAVYVAALEAEYVADHHLQGQNEGLKRQLMANNARIAALEAKLRWKNEAKLAVMPYGEVGTLAQWIYKHQDQSLVSILSSPLP
jgi:hypothetical protein